MRLSLVFKFSPSPCLHVSDYGLSTIAHVDMLHTNILLSSRAILLERFDLTGKRARQIIEHVGGAVLLIDRFDIAQLSGGLHCQAVDCSHLSSKHSLGFVAGSDALHHSDDLIKFRSIYRLTFA